MRIKVNFSILKELSGVDGTELSLPKSATLKDALAKISNDFPKFRKFKLQNWEVSSVCVLLNGVYATSQTQLKNDDEVSILPFGGGG